MVTTVKTSNRRLDFNCITGGCVKVTIPNPAASTTYGTSIPCKFCYVHIGAAGDTTYMNIDADASENTFLVGTPTVPNYVPIDDVNKLHFYGTAGNFVKILYFN